MPVPGESFFACLRCRFAVDPDHEDSASQRVRATRWKVFPSMDVGLPPRFHELSGNDPATVGSRGVLPEIDASHRRAQDKAVLEGDEEVLARKGVVLSPAEVEASPDEKELYKSAVLSRAPRTLLKPQAARLREYLQAELGPFSRMETRMSKQHLINMGNPAPTAEQVQLMVGLARKIAGDRIPPEVVGMTRQYWIVRLFLLAAVAGVGYLVLR